MSQKPSTIRLAYLGDILFIRSRPMKQFCVYILRCSDDSLYVGVTSQLKKRLDKHLEGEFPGAYTSARLPVHLVFVQYFPTSNEAFAFEKQLKNWSRKKKEALIAKDLIQLKALASCRNASHHSYQKKNNQQDGPSEVEAHPPPH